MFMAPRTSTSALATMTTWRVAAVRYCARSEEAVTDSEVGFPVWEELFVGTWGMEVGRSVQFCGRR